MSTVDTQISITTEAFIPVVREALNSLYDGISSLHDDIGGPPAPGSPYANELAVSRWTESLMAATSKSQILIETGGEHLNAFVRTITEPILPIACWTCIRSMLEPCARAAWILDPTIDGEERIKRTFAVWYDGLEQDLKYARSIKRPKRRRQEIKRGITKLERRATALGFDKLEDRSGKRTGIGMQMPGATDLIKKVLGAEGSYRLSSAVSHGQAGKILELSTVAVSGPRSARLHKKRVDPMRVGLLGIAAAGTLALPIWYEFGYWGWDRNRLTTLLETAFDRLGAGSAGRFWR